MVAATTRLIVEMRAFLESQMLCVAKIPHRLCNAMLARGPRYGESLLYLSVYIALGRAEAPYLHRMREQMKKLLLVVAACVIASPAYAQMASRGGIANSARVEQAAGAFAFSQIAQGERAEIESPRNDPLVRIDPGAFVMPYINDSFNASRGGDVRVYEPVGSFIEETRVFVDVTNPIP